VSTTANRARASQQTRAGTGLFGRGQRFGKCSAVRAAQQRGVEADQGPAQGGSSRQHSARHATSSKDNKNELLKEETVKAGPERSKNSFTYSNTQPTKTYV
jgi:hypothetical protein